MVRRDAVLTGAQDPVLRPSSERAQVLEVLLELRSQAFRRRDRQGALEALLLGPAAPATGPAGRPRAATRSTAMTSPTASIGGELRGPGRGTATTSAQTPTTIAASANTRAAACQGSRSVADEHRGQHEDGEQPREAHGARGALGVRRLAAPGRPEPAAAGARPGGHDPAGGASTGASSGVPRAVLRGRVRVAHPCILAHERRTPDGASAGRCAGRVGRVTHETPQRPAPATRSVGPARGPRLRHRLQPRGAAGRPRRPRLRRARRRGGRGPRAASGRSTSRARPASRRRSSRSRTSTTAPRGTRRSRRRWRCSRPDLIVLAGFMKLFGADVPRAVRRADRQHAPRAAAVVPRRARRARRARVRRQGHGLHGHGGRRGRRHRADPRAGRRSPWSPTTTRPRCTSGSRRSSSRCWSSGSAASRASGLRVEGRRAIVG